ncbi:LacI family transcriptional regulator [Mucilaginibacter robiniae]|uniref:LacI family transcriptional regulator n=1 Tax=Mucilaginibacter robiniae TaxID=2728022 RepID=A0A7L5E0V5_9SPHI|nr:LacI family DNA-binding transcriptional regulator [Mucilaginibacter robiniae]QJD96661.1 LacI family transcriptional regulator [Mucilaginibacter robiniae]
MSAVTLKMIAAELSLSVATVSKALADSYEISQATKNTVSEAAQRLGYVANPYASSLRKRRSKTIAVVLPEIADSFFAQAINGIETITQAFGYHVLIYLSHESFLREQAIMQYFKSGRVDGILMSVSEETSDTSHIKDVIDDDIPVVFFDRVCEDLPTAQIVTNDFESSFNATHHLLSKSCHKIAFIANSGSLSINRNRVLGYQKALQSVGNSNELIVNCGKNDEENYQLLTSLFNQEERPDGVILSVEKLTPLVYQVCNDLGVTIPTQVKVLTFTNLGIASFMNPALTTVNQPAFEMGQAAAKALFKKLSQNIEVLDPELVILPSKLICRESTR